MSLRSLSDSRIYLLGICMLLLLVMIALAWIIIASSQKNLIEFKSRQIANVVATQATAARSLYSRSVVAKLKKDGFSASTHSESTAGSVPIPAQFLKALAHDSSARSEGKYQFRPLSKWNLSPDQGLKDEFQRWAWAELEAQESRRLEAKVVWEPVWRIESFAGSKALRYLVADPAASQSCVDCHNAMEESADIQAMRRAAGVEVGKEWELHDLMGAIEVIIPVHESSELAATQTKNGLAQIFIVAVVGALLVLGLSTIDKARTKAMTRSLEYQAQHDALTTLPNRNGFEKAANHVLQNSDMSNTQHVMMLLDLNDFKGINDTLGHDVGDRVLEETAQRLLSTLSEPDVIARLGGDEFAVLLPASNPQRGEEVANQLYAALDQSIEIEDYKLRSHASIGIACMPRDGATLAQALRCADVAMYVSKRNRLHYAFYKSSEDHNEINKLSIAGDFRDALEREELQLALQPKFDIRAGRVTGVEALLRWRHPIQGMVPPAQLIPIAERCGLIQELTEWTVREGLVQLDVIHQINPELTLAVNLSAKLLSTSCTAEYILEQLGVTRVDPSKLIIEITETAMMDDQEFASQVLGMLHQSGVGISLDDFGTGYSSLAYLHRLPLQELKLDRSFVSGLGEDAKNKVIVRSAIELAANLGLALVAEGVETHDELHRLYDLNCSIVQGFFLCRPLFPDELARRLPELQLDAARLASFLSQGQLSRVA